MIVGASKSKLCQIDEQAGNSGRSSMLVMGQSGFSRETESIVCVCVCVCVERNLF